MDRKRTGAKSGGGRVGAPGKRRERPDRFFRGGQDDAGISGEPMTPSSHATNRPDGAVRSLFSPRVSGVFWASAVGVLVLDILSKAWTLRTLAPAPGASPFAPRASVSIIPGCIRFEYAENTGAAFSLFQNHPGVLTVIACILAGAVLLWSAFLPAAERLNRVALGLIFGGAVGNLIDRFRFGFVVDFIVAYWKTHAWPTFNVADSAICVGIGVFFLASYLQGRAEALDEGNERRAKADGKEPA